MEIGKHGILLEFNGIDLMERTQLHISKHKMKSRHICADKLWYIDRVSDTILLASFSINKKYWFEN